MFVGELRRIMIVPVLCLPLLGLAACDPRVRYDFVAESASGEEIRGSFVVSATPSPPLVPEDPEIADFPVRSAVVAGDPAEGGGVGHALRIFNNSQSRSADTATLLLFVDSLPNPASLELFLVDEDGEAFTSSALPVPFPPLGAFERLDVSLVRSATSDLPAPPPFHGALVSLIARPVPPNFSQVPLEESPADR